MTPAAYFTPRRQRLTALLAALVLFAGQIVLQQHVHADETAESVCVVCVQSDHTPITASVITSAQLLLVATCSARALLLTACTEVVTTYLSRAPPSS